MALADSLRKAASKAIGKLGGDVTVRIVTAGVYDSELGRITEIESETTLSGVLENVSLGEVNDLVQAGDKRLTVAASDLSATPKAKDRVAINGVVHQVIRVNTTEQDNTAIAHQLILRA